MNSHSNTSTVHLTAEQEKVKKALLGRECATVKSAPFVSTPVVVRFARPEAANAIAVLRSTAIRLMRASSAAAHPRRIAARPSRNVKALAIGAALLLSMSAGVKADSLYPGSSTAAKAPNPAINLFTDAKAHTVGDIVTIEIEENASSSTSAATQNSKTETGSLGPGVGPLLQQIGVLSMTGSQSMAGSGSSTRSDTLTAEIAVTVKQVLPNGNLMVEGTRKIGMNKETETITLTGVIRQQDIGTDNTVPSDLVADAQIAYGGKGPVGDKQREGLIAKLFKLVF